MTLLFGCLVGWLVVLLVVRWAERGIQEATKRAARDAVIWQQWLTVRNAQYTSWAIQKARLLDADDPDILTEGLGMVPPRYREKPVSLTSFAPADRALLEEAERALHG